MVKHAPCTTVVNAMQCSHDRVRQPPLGHITLQAGTVENATVTAAVSLPASTSPSSPACDRSGCAWGRRVEAESYHLRFDQGEDFRGHAIDRITSKQINEDVPIFEKVTVPPEADSRITPPLQMADLFACCIAHNDQTRKRSWHRILDENSVVVKKRCTLTVSMSAQGSRPLGQTACWSYCDTRAAERLSAQHSSCIPTEAGCEKESR
jgi:hypothetical protein